MNRKLTIIALLLVVVATGLIAQDLTIDYQLTVNRADPRDNFFTFSGPIRYIAVERDQVDARTGASQKHSTEIFQPYRYDVLGRNALPDGLRGLFLYAINPFDALEADNLQVSESGGVITVNYSHRGTAYQLVSDGNGRFVFPNGQYRKRTIGYIQGAGPQVISRDFSSDGTAARIDWARVWNSSTPDGRVVTQGVDRRTGPIVDDLASADAMYAWEGTLQASFRRNVLTIQGGLNAVER